ncbi:hypothetical protein I4U23_013130 [Adineta vaga]|nr:hypothetical protein I4U23_013130 [Adineta vaga]
MDNYTWIFHSTDGDVPFFHSFAFQAIYRLCRILYRTQVYLHSFHRYSITMFCCIWTMSHVRKQTSSYSTNNCYYSRVTTFSLILPFISPQLKKL